MHKPYQWLYFRNFTSNKVLDISIVIWKARQSDRDIPKLSYRSGMTALSKMSGQETPGLCLPVNYFFNGWNDGFREHAPRKGFHIAVMVMYIYQ